MSKAERFLVRSFDMGKGRAARDREVALHSPLMAVLSSPGDGPLEWLQTGQGLSAVLLHARSEEVSASFLNQAVEEPETRERLAELLGGNVAPQILLRLGFGPEVQGTPRRPLLEVMLKSPHTPFRLGKETRQTSIIFQPSRVARVSSA